MFDLYIANKNYSSWSLRPWVLLRERGVPFNEHLVPFGRPGAPSAFAGISPTLKVPCLVDGDQVVWDSLSIVEYIAEADPAAWPMDSAPRAWARSASAEMHSGFQALREHCTMNVGVRIRLHAEDAGVRCDWARIEALWLEGLSRFGGPFLAGAAFTAVDAFYAPVAFRAQTYSPALGAKAQAYVDRLLALPSMQDWYAAALQETWREEAHEAEAREVGEWLADHRAGAAG